MSIFAKAVSQIVPADLRELLEDRAVENARLEFKLQVPDKDETLKKLSSFANTFGGYMVIGAKASSRDGRIEGLLGVARVDGYRQKVVDWCFGGASPPLIVTVSDPIETPAVNGNVCYVIYVAESEVAPHFLNGRKGVWVRSDEFSARFEARLADEKELRHLFDRRKVVRERRANLLERARKRFDTYSAKLHTDLSGNRTKAVAQSSSGFGQAGIWNGGPLVSIVCRNAPGMGFGQAVAGPLRRPLGLGPSLCRSSTRKPPVREGTLPVRHRPSIAAGRYVFPWRVHCVSLPSPAQRSSCAQVQRRRRER